MKQCMKRLHCPTCNALVRCHDVEEGGKLQIICNRCDNKLFSRQSDAWRYVKVEAVVVPKKKEKK